MESIAERMFDGDAARSMLEDRLADVGLEMRIGWDYYDCSIELYEVDPDVRLTAEQQKVICDAGFQRAYVNHTDGWETHYTWDRGVSPVRGWRRRWVRDAAAETDRQVGGGDPGYYEISYWPEGWGSRDSGRCGEWLKTGYMRIVPDPLEPASDHAG